MKLVLKDLINANFKNLQMDPQGNLIYTLLPIVDERENKKIRNLFVLYYTALYYDNVDLLQQMLSANVQFELNNSLRLQYLDKFISSKFDTTDYIENIKKFGETFANFVTSIKNLSDEEKEKYSQKFLSLFKLKYKEMCEIQEKKYSRYELKDLFALADIVVSRAGANAICELLALHKPNILIPLSAAASRGDQILNARSFEKQGFSYVIEEETLTVDILLEAIRKVYANREDYRQAMEKSNQMDSVETILQLIESEAGK